MSPKSTAQATGRHGSHISGALIGPGPENGADAPPHLLLLVRLTATSPTPTGSAINLHPHVTKTACYGLRSPPHAVLMLSLCLTARMTASSTACPPMARYSRRGGSYRGWGLPRVVRCPYATPRHTRGRRAPVRKRGAEFRAASPHAC